jgi:hypothetical protein
MRTVHELNENELNELREAYFDQLQSCDDEVLGDINSADGIPIENVKQHYDGILFSDDDFFCNI